jgi:hypothetical protein
VNTLLRRRIFLRNNNNNNNSDNNIVVYMCMCIHNVLKMYVMMCSVLVDTYKLYHHGFLITRQASGSVGLQESR